MSKIDNQQTKPYPKEVDVIVVGSGAAGFSAALTAAIGGLEVLLLEKAAVFGGTTAISGGAIWVPESKQAKEMGLKDSRADVFSYLKELVGDELKVEMIDAYLDAAPKMLDLFEKHTHLKFTAREISPDYHHGMKGTVSGGRTMDTAFFDGRLLGKDFAKLRSPLSQFMLMGGMMLHVKDVEKAKEFGRSFKSTKHLLGLLFRYFMDRLKYPRGTRLIYGNALVAAALKSAIDKGIDLRSQSPVTGILHEEGQVKGVSVQANNQQTDIKARLGVVLAAGGAPHHPKWRETYLRTPGNHYSMANRGNNGVVMELAIEAGAYLEGNQSNAFIMPVSVLESKDGETKMYPHLLGDRLKPGSIAVDSSGLRFTNESASYHSFVRGMYKRNKSEDTKPAYIICDHSFITKYGMGFASFGRKDYQNLIDAKYLFKGETIDELADKLEIHSTNLIKTIKAVNVFAEKGHDPDFGKGSSEYNKYMGDQTHTPNPCLGKIETAPYYAIKIWPGDFGTSCGLATDKAARVLTKDKKPIGNLYACGNEMSSMMSGFYPGGGITLGPGLTFGYLAAKDMIERKRQLFDG